MEDVLSSFQDFLPAFDYEEDSDTTSEDSVVVNVQKVIGMSSNQVTIKTSVDLPVYSGHPVNTKYTGKDGTCTELSRVQDWLFEINKIGKAGGWTPEIMATQAAMKLVPGFPAGNWMKVVEQSRDAAKIAENYPDRSGPAAVGWLRSDHHGTRLVGADASSDGPGISIAARLLSTAAAS